MNIQKYTKPSGKALRLSKKDQRKLTNRKSRHDKSFLKDNYE
jgi:hypothetical protein